MQPPPPSGYLPVANWRYWEVLVVFLSGAMASVAVAVVVVAAGADPLAPIPFSAVFGAQAVASFGMAWYLSRTRGSGSLAADTGLVINGSDWWGVPAGMGLQIAIAIVTAPIIVWIWPDGPPAQSVAEVAESSETLLEQLVVVAVVAVGAPIIEEMIFRGMLLSILARSFSRWPAILMSAMIFAAVHMFDPNAIAVIPGLFLLGIVLGWVAMRRGDLSLPISLHSGINLLAAITLLYGDSVLDWANEQLDQLEQLEAIVRMF